MVGSLAIAFFIGAFPSMTMAAESSLVAMLGATEPETLVVQITLNTENKGQFFVSAADGDFLIRVGTSRRWASSRYVVARRLSTARRYRAEFDSKASASGSTRERLSWSFTAEPNFFR